MRTLTVIAVLWSLVGACSGSGGDAASGGAEKPEPAPKSPWKPATVELDPDCHGCEELGSLPVPHGGEATLLINRELDDEIAQWGDCLDAVDRCLVAGKSIGACAKNPACPAECLEEFSARIRDLEDESALLSAFEAVFVDDGGFCVPRGDP